MLAAKRTLKKDDALLAPFGESARVERRKADDIRGVRLMSPQNGVPLREEGVDVPE
jgi:hypothetical protein